ncbi:MAG: dTDP-4-dehydrorhamnose 3,5-epimerase family protein [Bacteroidota bacterium]
MLAQKISYFKFAYGFSVLSDNVIKRDNYYSKESERGVFYAGAELNIDWRIKKNDTIISEKDKIWPLLKNADFNF